MASALVLNIPRPGTCYTTEHIGRAAAAARQRVTAQQQPLSARPALVPPAASRRAVLPPARSTNTGPDIAVTNFAVSV